MVTLSVASRVATAAVLAGAVCANAGDFGQGPKLFGTGAVGGAQQGFSVALSSDGNTAIVGGIAASSSGGAASVFTRTGSVWTQQGAKLVGTGAVGNAGQGISVALSSDGKTAILGGCADSSSVGAAWVFMRSGGVWTQQGAKLVGTGTVGSALQGISVALSSDGNTAIVGGPSDNSSAGAVWLFTRERALWTHQAANRYAPTAHGSAHQALPFADSSHSTNATV